MTRRIAPEVSLWCYRCADIYRVSIGIRHLVRGPAALIQPDDGSVAAPPPMATLEQLRNECKRLLRGVGCPVCRARLHPTPRPVVDV